MLAMLKRCVGGLVLGAIGTVILILNQIYFFSAWGLLLLFGLCFVKEKLLNAAIYGGIIVFAICIVKQSLSFAFLLVIPLLCILLLLWPGNRNSKDKEQ